MLYVALHFKAESYEESRSNTLIKICKRNGLLHSKYTSSFINKVCSFWKNYRSSGLGYKNFVVVWFNYYFQFTCTWISIISLLIQDCKQISIEYVSFSSFPLNYFLQLLSLLRERGKWWPIGWKAEMIWTNSTIAWFANLCQRRKGLEPYWQILAAPWSPNPNRQPRTSIRWRI